MLAFYTQRFWNKTPFKKEYPVNVYKEERMCLLNLFSNVFNEAT